MWVLNNGHLSIRNSTLTSCHKDSFLQGFTTIQNGKGMENRIKWKSMQYDIQEIFNIHIICIS